MAKNSDISWTDDTFNTHWGCERVSPACAHCYADASAKRFGYPGLWEGAGARRFFDEGHWRTPLLWDRNAVLTGGVWHPHRRLVFCASMSDVFEDHEDLPTVRARLWALIEDTENLTWQLLTKRPENVLRMVPSGWRDGLPGNVWVGTSIENARWAHRADSLREIPAVIRFLSCEPLLGPLWQVKRGVERGLDLDGIGWVIGGGESGPHHRPTDPRWAVELKTACRNRGIPFFWKQNGGRYPKANGKLLNGAEYCEFPATEVCV